MFPIAAVREYLQPIYFLNSLEIKLCNIRVSIATGLTGLTTTKTTKVATASTATKMKISLTAINTALEDLSLIHI